MSLGLASVSSGFYPGFISGGLVHKLWLQSPMSGPDLATLQAWLAEVLQDSPPDWQVEPSPVTCLAHLSHLPHHASPGDS